MKITAFGKTDIGNIRENNEDNLLILDISSGKEGDVPVPISSDNGVLLVVADGMGGAAAGETASLIMVTEALKFVQANSQMNPPDMVRQCLFAAHIQCHRMIKLNPPLAGMGTVATVCLLKGSKLSISQIGDTRLYLHREQTLEQITEDQNFVSELVKIGLITPEQALIHPQRNAVTQAVGSIEPIEPVEYSLDLKDKDRILICSDGLNSMISDMEIQLILETEMDLEDTVDRLIAAAKDSGGYDNITVILAEVSE